jgi:hypothetical protein
MMDKLFERRTAAILLFICLPLLFLPKINLIGFGEQTAGLRLDDLVLLGFALICYLANGCRQSRFLEIEQLIVAITLLSLLSFGISRTLFAAQLLPVKGSLFYCGRLLEYFLFFYLGGLAARFCRIESIIKAFFLWNLLLMLLQKLQLVGIFSVEGYIAHPDDRMLGIASFGSEIGLLLNLVFCFMIYQKRTTSNVWFFSPSPAVLWVVDQLYPYLLLLLFILLVVLSGARMAIFALFVSFLFCIRGKVRWHRPVTWLLPAVTLCVGALLTFFALYHASGIVTRSKGLFSLANIDLISIVWHNIPLDYDPIGREAIHQGQHDASWWMRIHKWCYAAKLYALHPACWLQGVGPGFAMAALDGGFLRILTELGVVGCLLYGRLFYLIAILSTPLFWMMVAFLLNMLFFDAYLAYKPMSLLFLVVGHTCASNASGAGASYTSGTEAVAK